MGNAPSTQENIWAQRVLSGNDPYITVSDM